MIKETKFYERIEDIPDKELHERIKKSMTQPLTYNGKFVSIKPVPYYGGIKSWVKHSYEDQPELIARCPMTGVHDLYKVSIEYIPNKVIPELKSLKFYLFGFQNFPISHEHITARIYKDFMETIKPLRMRIRVWVASRGEITTVICYDSKYGIEQTGVINQLPEMEEVSDRKTIKEDFE